MAQWDSPVACWGLIKGILGTWSDYKNHFLLNQLVFLCVTGIDLQLVENFVLSRPVRPFLGSA